MTDAFESRHLGPLKLNVADDRGTFDTELPFQGEKLTVRIEIEHLDRYSMSVVNDIDMVAENLEFIDGLARETISAGMRDPRSTPSKLFSNWEQWGSGRRGATADFLEALLPTRIAIQPDGGFAQPDRVVMTYRLDDRNAQGEVSVRFLEPTGPKLAD